MRRALLTAAVALLTLAPAAQAHTTIDPSSGTTHHYQRWVNRSLAPTPDVTLQVVEGDANDPDWINSGSCAGTGRDGQIWMSIAPASCTWTPRRDFYHELGHNFDYYELDPWARRRFEAILGDDRPWTTAAGRDNSPNELFADLYGYCAIGGGYEQDFGDRPITARQHRLICRAIRHSYADKIPSSCTDVWTCDPLSPRSRP